MQEEGPAPKVVIGGFPKSYYLRTELAGHATRPNISISALMQNAAMWLVLLFAILAFELHAASGKRDGVERSKRSFGLLDILIAIGVVAGVLGQWRRLDARYEESRKLASLIGSLHGEARSAVYLPPFIAKCMPAYVKKRFTLIHNVHLDNPSTELLDQVLDQPMIQRLRIGGGKIDTSVTERIGQLPLLWDLRLGGVELQPEDISNLASVADRLVALNLMRTNITWQGIDALGDLPRLRHLGLSHTNCRLADLDRPTWAATIEELVLPHPGPGGSDTLELDGWPALKTLAVVEFDEVKNDSPVSLSLRNMQSLDKLQLDPLQNFVLELEDVSLSAIEHFDAQLSVRARNENDVPGSLYLSQFKIKNAPNLSELSVFGPTLESYHIAGTPTLNFGIGTFYHQQASPMTSGYYLVDRRQVELQEGVRQGWIDDLGRCEGPQIVDFAAISLLGCDLTPLAQNTGLRRIDLSLTGIDQELHDLKSEHITELLATQLPIRNGFLHRLLRQLPNLQRIEISPDRLRTLKLRDNQRLQSIFPQDNNIMMNVSEIELRDLPEFQETIVASRLLTECTIVNTPKLRQIHILYPLPENSTLSGLEGLVKFATGGAHVDDAVFSELLNCQNLESLQLSHASISRDSLMSLSSLTSLKHLCLYGCNVDDAVVEEIAKLSQLETLALDFTGVTAAASNSLAQLQKLKTLRIDGTPLAKSDLSFLPRLPDLRELRIGGATLDLKLTSTLKQISGLSHLEITGGQLTKEGVDAFASAGSPVLRQLGLRDINQPNLDISGFAKLPNVTFDLTGAEFLPTSIDLLYSQRRNRDFRPMPFVMAPSLGTGMVWGGSNSVSDVTFYPEVFRPNYQFHPSASTQEIIFEGDSSGSYFSASTLPSNALTQPGTPYVTPTTQTSAVESLFYWLGYGIGEMQRSTTLSSDEGASYEEF